MSMKRTLAIALVALGAPIAASAADLSGTWAVNGDFGSKLRYTLVCVLKSDGQALSGPCATIQGRARRTGGHLDGDKMTFSYTTDYNGSGEHLTYSGAVQPDGVVKGVVDTGGSKGEFQATPLTGAVAGQSTPYKLDVTLDTGLAFTVICTLKTQGSGLNGFCAVVAGSTLQTTGSSDGTNVTLSYDTEYQGHPVHDDYMGAVQPNGSLKGVIKAAGDSGTFTATRQ